MAKPSRSQDVSRAAYSLVGIVTETLINWIKDRDDLHDEAPVRWFGHIVRQRRRITRTVYRLEA